MSEQTPVRVDAQAQVDAQPQAVVSEASKALVAGAAKERGVALIMVVACLAIIFPFMTEFGYRARVDWQGAINQGDEIRARNVQRGALRISVLMFELQRMLFNRKQIRDQLGVFDVTQFSGYLMSVFGTPDGAAGIGAMTGLKADGLPDLSLGEGYSFEVRVLAEGGRINVNCLADTQGNGDRQLQTARALQSLMLPTLYDPLFEEEKNDGERYRREEVLASIVDYVDYDLERFDPQRMTSSSASEISDYTQLHDPYQARNARLDSVQELHLVQGIDDDWMAAFGPALTVYGGCKVNLNFASAEMIANVIAAAVSREHQWMVQGDNYAYFAQRMANFIVQNREMNLFKDLKSFVDLVANPAATASPLAGMLGQEDETDDQVRAMNQMLPEPIKLNFKQQSQSSSNNRKRRPGQPPKPDPQDEPSDADEVVYLSEIASVDPESTYRVEITTEVGAVSKRLVGVYGMNYVRSRIRGKGAWLFLREE